MRHGMLAAGLALVPVCAVASCAQGLTDPARSSGWLDDAADEDVVGDGRAANDGDTGSIVDGVAADTSSGGGDGAADSAGDAIGPDADGSEASTCSAGQPCTQANPCATGKIDCSTGIPVCTAAGHVPDGTSCGTNQVCASGSCIACTQGASCTPSNACHTGTTDCSVGAAACTDTGSSLANGTSCGTSSVCESGACSACGGMGQYCCAGGACGGSPQACISAVASSCRSNVTPQCTCGSLLQGMQLHAGQQLGSCDGRFSLAMQTDGNLVLYESSTALWSSNTAGTGGALATMQDDGNFVVYTGAGVALWSSVTAGAGCGAYVAVQNDGNTVIYNSGGTALWSTGTCCR
jgi:hypothetical protein